MKKNIYLLILILICFGCEKKTYKFAVICDTRSDAENNGVTGVNVPAVKAVCDHLIKSGAEFVIAPGDFICGNVTWYNKTQTPPKNATQYQAFIDAINSQGIGLPDDDKKIKLYPLRGNHECYHQILTKQEIKNEWVTSIGNKLPNNGPKGEKGFSYSFSYKGSLFIGIDQYMNTDSTEKKNIKVNQNWINEVLEQNQNADHVFAFGHTPAFSAHHRDCLGEYPELRNDFLQSISNKSGAYFCGHDHFYARAGIPVYSKNGKIKKYMQQIITPSGAPFLGGFSPKWEGVYQNKEVKSESYIDNAVGYQLVTVEGNKVTVQFFATNDACTFTVDSTYHYTYKSNWKEWNFEVMDTFSYEL